MTQEYYYTPRTNTNVRNNKKLSCSRNGAIVLDNINLQWKRIDAFVQNEAKLVSLHIHAYVRDNVKLSKQCARTNVRNDAKILTQCTRTDARNDVKLCFPRIGAYVQDDVELQEQRNCTYIWNVGYYKTLVLLDQSSEKLQIYGIRHTCVLVRKDMKHFMRHIGAIVRKDTKLSKTRTRTIFHTPIYRRCICDHWPLLSFMSWTSRNAGMFYGTTYQHARNVTRIDELIFS